MGVTERFGKFLFQTWVKKKHYPRAGVKSIFRTKPDWFLSSIDVMVSQWTYGDSARTSFWDAKLENNLPHRLQVKPTVRWWLRDQEMRGGGKTPKAKPNRREKTLFLNFYRGKTSNSHRHLSNVLWTTSKPPQRPCLCLLSVKSGRS